LPHGAFEIISTWCSSTADSNCC